MGEYISRNIDKELIAWRDNSMRKPLLLRGARQVGKSSAVRNIGKTFKYFAEVNFERHKAIKAFFQGDIDVRMIAQKISSYINVPMVAGETLLFFDEIQECPEAIMALRFFKEDYPELHVITESSLPMHFGVSRCFPSVSPPLDLHCQPQSSAQFCCYPHV